MPEKVPTSAEGPSRYYGMWKSMERSDTEDRIQQSRRKLRDNGIL